jgi:hypothetical protein
MLASHDLASIDPVTGRGRDLGKNGHRFIGVRVPELTRRDRYRA